MQKFLFCLFLMSAIQCMGQRVSSVVWQGSTEWSTDFRQITDTIKPWGNNNVSPNLFVSQNGGYLVGVNGYGDKQAAQIFMNNFPLQVTGALFWFGGKHITSGNPSSSVVFKLFALDSNNLSNATSSNAKCPGTVLSSVTVPVITVQADTLINSGINFVQFPTAVNIDSAAGFALGFSVTALAAGDTIGLMTTADGDAAQKDFSVQQWKNGTWNSFLDPNNWDSDIDLYILAITEHELVSSGEGLSDESFLNVYPNPVSDFCFLKTGGSMLLKSVRICALNGTEILSLNLTAYSDSVCVDMRAFGSGIYLMEAETLSGSVLRKKISVN